MTVEASFFEMPHTSGVIARFDSLIVRLKLAKSKQASDFNRVSAPGSCLALYPVCGGLDASSRRRGPVDEPTPLNAWRAAKRQSNAAREHGCLRLQSSQFCPPLQLRRGLRVHPSEEAKVDECGSAKASQKWFQVGHARILGLDLSFAGDGTSRPRQGLPWPTRPGFLSFALSLPFFGTF
jgi:hypothetical protein